MAIGLAIVLIAASAVTISLLHSHTEAPVLYSAPEELLAKAPAIEPTATTTLRIPILIYHTVHPSRSDETASQKKYNVTPDVLDEELQYLNDHGFTVISTAQMVADLAAGTTTGAKPVVIAFDDGSQGQYEYAFPVLEKYHDTATFYIYTHPIDTNDPYFLTWDEVKDMSAAGMTIGSHTVDHPYLTKLPADKVAQELTESKQTIEAEIGKPVVDFATPFGATNDAVQAAIAAAGYETSRGTNRGAMHTSDDLLDLTGYFAPNNMQQFEWIVEYAK